MRHLIDDDLIPNKGSVAAKRQVSEELLTPVLTNPTKTFSWKLGDTKTRAFAGMVRGKMVVVFVAMEGPYRARSSRPWCRRPRTCRSGAYRSGFRGSGDGRT
ncbi:hypothetical protein [Spongiactinospora sp. TRM90649]|uniref:hypothetical protein n=1 Tax=Spongiactinospora sp. TRM90649 TaxID=3031114 RepID=UPI0023F929B5|nr:hypothetical protein [Spongiactinospora sp. TRM90649]MDF5757365.1 hypothetical protein [Spongiactinospora sp. TRM90649]